MAIVTTKGRDYSESWGALYHLSAALEDMVIREVILQSLFTDQIHLKTACSAPAAVLRCLRALSSVWNAGQK